MPTISLAAARSCAGYLVETQDLRMLVDCGSGITRRLAERGPEWQTISHVAYVKAGAASVPATPSARSSEAGAPVDSAGVPRTLLFVVDDLGLSTESAVQMREAFSELPATNTT